MSFKWGISTEVKRNREAFLGKNGIDARDCVVMQPQHADNIVVVDGRFKEHEALTPSKEVSVDALLTREKGLVLFLLTADCFPTAYYDPVRAAIALVHLGRGPTEKKLAAKVVDKMIETFDTDPGDLLVQFGPGIHKDSYLIRDPEQKIFAEWKPYLEETPAGLTKIDLITYNVDQLRQRGVRKENMYVDEHDTATSDLYYSHYRSVRSGEPEGRFATIFGLK